MMDSRGEKRKREADDHDGVLSKAPRDILILRYAESHAAEIDALIRDVQQTGGGKKVSQKLPRHMRRRATSHSIKRLPRKIRNIAAIEYENQADKVMKRPSRKYRRRHRNLLKEYNRRQQKSVWLETHIWHAKRFHMAEKYGYKIPLQPTSKGLRAAYRAASQHCLLQDMSYMCCIEVQGPQQSIVTGLSHLTSPGTGLTFASKSCLNGTREGNTFVYEYDKYPWNLIGQVSFLWNTNLSGEDTGKYELTNPRQLWIWSHPSIYDQIWTELLKCFEIKLETSEGDFNSDNASVHSKNMHEQFKTGEEIKKNAADEKKNNVLKNRTAGNGVIIVVSLKDCLNRFRLTGPLSHGIIVDCLQETNIAGNDGSKDTLWWQTFYANVANSLSHSQQRDFWNSVKPSQSPAEFAPHCIVGLTVRDPRLCRPVKRTKLKLDPQGVQSDTSACCEKLSPQVSASPIWNPEIRQKVKNTRMSDHHINTLKSEQMVPGFPLDLGVEESRIPILLLQQPGYQSADQVFNPRCSRRPTGFGSGWDIIIPSGWAISFWISLIFRGARAVGILDSERSAQEQGMLHFPMDFPDCHVGWVEAKMRRETLEGKYRRMPPAKRPNFIKLGVTSPFSCPWSTLVQNWMGVPPLRKTSQNSDDVQMTGGGDSAKTDDMRTDIEPYADGEKCQADGIERTFFVLREKKNLRQLKTLCQKKSMTKEAGHTNKNGDKVENSSTSENSLLNEADDFLNIMEQEQPQALVPVEVKMLHKGCPTPMSLICIPDKSDLEELQRNKSYGGPFEPQHKDSIEMKKRKMKKIIKEYKTNEAVITKRLKLEIKEKVEMEYNNKKVENDPISRHIIGYVNNGGFSFAQGTGIGKGYCSLIGIVHTLRDCSNANKNMTILVRNPTSLQYRFAVLSVLC